MIELPSGLNFHNFNLDCKTDLWFKKRKEETVKQWLARVSYDGDDSLLNDFKWREFNEYWSKDSFKISFSVLSFLAENKLEKETFEELIGFELNLKGSHNWTLSEIKKLELMMNIKLL